jgi:hypothetical protein
MKALQIEVTSLRAQAGKRKPGIAQAIPGFNAADHCPDPNPDRRETPEENDGEGLTEEQLAPCRLNLEYHSA